MGTSGGVTLFRFRGIRVSADYSWFFVLFLVIWWLSGFYRDVLGTDSSAVAPYLLAVASALLFFGSIVLHEFGHALVAIRNGIGIDGIQLWLFGGVARMERDSDTPMTELKVAIAGPLVTLLIVLVCSLAGVAIAGPDEFRRAALEEGNVEVGALAALLGWLAGINALVLVFNLVPAYPLDGGRVARALAWWKTGSRAKATRLSARLGQGFALVLIGLGALMLISGNVLGGIWIAVLGFILNGSARSAVSQSKLASSIEGISVVAVSLKKPPTPGPRTTAAEALDDYFVRYGWPWFPAADASGRFIGVIDRETVERLVAEGRGDEPLTEAVASDDGEVAIEAEAPLEDALDRDTLTRLGGLVAVDPTGRIRGLLTAPAVERALGNQA